MTREQYDLILAGLNDRPARVAHHGGRSIASLEDLEFVARVEGFDPSGEPGDVEVDEVPEGLDRLTTEALYELCRTAGISPVPKLKAERIAALEALRPAAGGE